MTSPVQQLLALTGDGWVGWRPVAQDGGPPTPARVASARLIQGETVELAIVLAINFPRASLHEGVFTCLGVEPDGSVLGVLTAPTYPARQVWIERITPDWLSSHIPDFVTRCDDGPYQEFEVVGQAEPTFTAIDYLDWQLGSSPQDVLQGAAPREPDWTPPDATPSQFARHRLGIELDALDTYLFLRGRTPHVMEDRLAAYEDKGAGAIVVRRSWSSYEVFRVLFHLVGDRAHLDEAVVPLDTPYGGMELVRVLGAIRCLLLHYEWRSLEDAASERSTAAELWAAFPVSEAA